MILTCKDVRAQATSLDLNLSYFLDDLRSLHLQSSIFNFQSRNFYLINNLRNNLLAGDIAGALPTVSPVTTAAEIIKAREVVREVYIDEKIEQYIADIVFATRYPDRYGLKDMKDMISFGGSPRASINLAKAARAYAFIKRRGYVVPEDVRAVAYDVLRHRIGLTYEAEASNITSEEIISNIINKVEVP